MARLPLIDPATATGRTHSLLDGVEKQLGFVPNLMRAAANSPAALAGYLNLSGQLAGGVLDAQTRERIALAVAEQNACTYCLAAHSTIGASVGLDTDEIRQARLGSSHDAKAAAAVALAAALVTERGHVPAGALDAARSAGLDNAVGPPEVRGRSKLHFLPWQGRRLYDRWVHRTRWIRGISYGYECRL